MLGLLLFTLLNLHADTCPQGTGEAVGECAKQSCQAIAACNSAASAAESASAQQSGDAGKALEAEPNLALGAFQLSDVAASSSAKYAAAIKYCQEKPTALCNSVCADSKAKEPAKISRLKSAREACLSQIKATTDRLDNGKRGSDQAKAGGDEAGKSSAAQPASGQPSSSPSGGDDAKKDKDSTSTKSADGQSGGAGAGGGGAPPSMPSSPSSSPSQSSAKDQAPGRSEPDCSSDMSSPTCASQWQARCASASTSGPCAAFTGQFCQGANAHAAYCVSSATARVCNDPTAASSCPVCLQARGIPVSPLVHTFPAICGTIPTLAAQPTATNGSSSPQSVGGGGSGGSASGMQPSSVEAQAPGAAFKEGDDLYKKLDAGVNGGGGGGGGGGAAATSPEPSLDVMSLMSAVPRAAPVAEEGRRPASDVESSRTKASLFFINSNVLVNFCRGSRSPSCLGTP